MIFLYDNIYGKLTFPKYISELLDCPGLLRLKEIGMSNVKFVCFPSFSAVSRYEHALGVCHLANIAADSLSLSEKDKIELMIAAKDNASSIFFMLMFTNDFGNCIAFF
jgi:HD superfamily phosphohydrolase